MKRNYFYEKERELTWKECWDIIEDMTCNMSDEEREDWLESME